MLGGRLLHKPPFEATTKLEKLAVLAASPFRRQRNGWANFVVGVTAISRTVSETCEASGAPRGRPPGSHARPRESYSDVIPRMVELEAAQGRS